MFIYLFYLCVSTLSFFCVFVWMEFLNSFLEVVFGFAEIYRLWSMVSSICLIVM